MAAQTGSTYISGTTIASKFQRQIRGFQLWQVQDSVSVLGIFYHHIFTLSPELQVLPVWEAILLFLVVGGRWNHLGHFL